MDATLSAYNPTWRDRLAQWMLGDGRPTAGQRDFVSGLLGSAGTGSTGLSVADLTPAGGLLGAQEAAQGGDYKGAALAMLPMPAKAAGGVLKAAERAPYARKLSPQGLYSWGAEAAYNLPQETMTVQQARKMLESAGTKPEEFKWSGFDAAFPDQNAKVARGALVSHFESNVPQLGETVLGHDPRIDELTARIEQLNAENEALPFIVRNSRSGFTSPSFPTYEAAQEYVAGMPESLRGLLDVRRQPNPMAEAQFDRLTAQRRGLLDDAQPTKYEKYALDGGDNYREMLTTIKPGSRLDAIAEQMGFGGWHADMTPEQKAAAQEAYRAQPVGATLYRSSHWDNPNVLAHTRMSDRVDMEGNKVLHLEESQSDWGQEGRKKGFVDPDAESRALQERENLLSRRQELRAQRDKINATVGDIPEDLFLNLTSANPDPERLRQFYAWNDPIVEATRPIEAELEAIGPRIEASIEAARKARNGVPEAPYVGSTGNKSATGWTDLNLKRALWEAANNSADRLAWTPGAEHAARYSLPDDSGMKAYYDRTIPTQLSAVLKRAGIQGGEFGKTFVELPYSNNRASFAELPSINLTPEMREKIKKGLPYFGLAPFAFGGLLGSQQQFPNAPAL